MSDNRHFSQSSREPVGRLRAVWHLLRWDLALRRHQAATRRRLVALLAPIAMQGWTLAAVLDALPADERAQACEALARVDLSDYCGHFVDRLYALLDDVGGRRR